MSIIQHHTSASLTDAWRTINIDALTEDSSVNFDTSTLRPPLPEVSDAEVRQLAQQIRQLLRGGDPEGALRGCLEMPVYQADEPVKVRQHTCLLSRMLGSRHNQSPPNYVSDIIWLYLGRASPDCNRGAAVNQG